MFSSWVLGNGCDSTHQHPPMRPFLKEMQLFQTISSILHFCSGGAEFQSHSSCQRGLFILIFWVFPESIIWMIGMKHGINLNIWLLTGKGSSGSGSHNSRNPAEPNFYLYPLSPKIPHLHPFLKGKTWKTLQNICWISLFLIKFTKNTVIPFPLSFKIKNCG